MTVTDLIDTTEMYLRTIFELEEEGIVPLRARIAERLGHSGPTVSQTVARMERDGLVAVSGDRHLELSDHGRLLATRVMRKHRLAERLLVDVIGLEWEYAHDEACRWEHVMSEKVERKILGLIGEGLESPYGNPIPGLDELGRAPGRGLPHRPQHPDRGGRRRAGGRDDPPHRRARPGRPRGARAADERRRACPAPGSRSCATAAGSSPSARAASRPRASPCPTTSPSTSSARPPDHASRQGLPRLRGRYARSCHILSAVAEIS